MARRLVVLLTACLLVVPAASVLWVRDEYLGFNVDSDRLEFVESRLRVIQKELDSVPTFSSEQAFLASYSPCRTDKGAFNQPFVSRSWLLANDSTDLQVGQKRIVAHLARLGWRKKPNWESRFTTRRHGWTATAEIYGGRVWTSGKGYIAAQVRIDGQWPCWRAQRPVG